MNRRHLGATLAGGFTLFVAGFLLYGIVLSTFIQSSAAPGGVRDPPLVWAIAAGDFIYSGFLTLLFTRLRAGQSFADGFRFGTVVGLLTSLSESLIQYATHPVTTLLGTALNPIAFALLAGMAGGVIARVLMSVSPAERNH